VFIAKVYNLARLESLLSSEMQRVFKDGSFSIVLPKAAVSVSWESAAAGALSLSEGQFVGVIDAVPNSNYMIGLVPSHDNVDRVNLRGVNLRARMGFFPKSVITFRLPITFRFSQRTHKLTIEYAYWPWNAYGVLLSASGTC